MKFFVCHYQHKSKPFRKALIDSGFRQDERNPDVALFDRDWFMHNDKKPRWEVERYKDKAVVMVYPHSALPPWWYDGLIKIQPYVKCVFVIGEGQREAMKSFAPNMRVEVTGWAWSDIVPFTKPENEKVKKVLFMPIHPAGGRLRPEAVTANRKIIEDLQDLQKRMNLEVTVRYIGALSQQGLSRKSGFIWLEGGTDAGTKQIDESDVVIAEGTALYLSVARGKPTIGINQHLPIRANKKSDIYTPRTWDIYKHHLVYPLNYGDKSLPELFGEAMTEKTDWRVRLVGEQMDGKDFAQKVAAVWMDNKPFIKDGA